MTQSSKYEQEMLLQILGMRYHKAIIEKEKLYKKLFHMASSYVKEIYDGELEDVLMNISFTKPNTVIIIYTDKNSISQRIEIPLWGE